jgi:hypothetical protein
MTLTGQPVKFSTATARKRVAMWEHWASALAVSRSVRAAGLPYPFADDPDFEYGDCWDVMSFATTTFQARITF